MKDLKEAYRRLADAQANDDPDAATAAYQDIGRLIETLPDQPLEALPAMPGMDFGDDENLPPDEKIKKVLQSLYDAALAGNVPAILKYIEMSRAPGPSEPEPTTSTGKRKPKRKPRISKKLAVKEVKFLEHYFDCAECRGNATKAAGHAGFKGSSNVLAVTGYNLLRKPKIQEYVVARLEASAMSIEEVLRGISETAAGVAQHVIDMTSGRPVISLAKAVANGKLHLIKGITFHANGEVKAIQWDSPLQAKIALARYHQLTDPGAPPDAELTPEELSRIAVARARGAIEIAIKVAARHGIELTFEEAAQKAVQHGFPAAKDLVNRESKGVN
jgi:hypothetical protein